MKRVLSHFDMRLTTAAQALPDFFRPVFVAASFVGLPIFTIGLCIVIALVGFEQQRYRLMLDGLVGLGIIVIGNILKLLVRRTRPVSARGHAKRYRTYSFPSGHAVGSMMVFGLLALLATGSASSNTGWIWLTDGLLIAAIGVSRVYLGAHFPTDVLAGWLMGALALLALGFSGGF